MALLLNISQTDVGAAFDAAYARVAHAVIENDFDQAPRVDAVVEFYANQQARTIMATPVHRMNVSMGMPSGDFMPGLYTALKATPGFEGAVDC